MANLREAAGMVDWQQAHADASAIAAKQLTFGQLSAARQENLQRARALMASLAQAENYYRTQTVSRLDTYAKLKTEYVKYIKQRDEAALQGKTGSIGLTVFYTIDMVGNGLAAAGVPMAKFYTAVRSVGDKSVAAYETLRPYVSGSEPAKVAAPPTPAGGARGASAGNIPDMGFRMAHGLPTAAPSSQTAPPGPAAPSPLATHAAEENTRAVIRTMEAAREVHKALSEAVELDRANPGVNRLREWTRRQQDNEKPAPFSVSKAGGQIADSTFRTITSLNDLDAALRSRDTSRIFDAQTKAVRDTLKTGTTMLEVLQKDRKLAGEHGVSGQFPASAQVVKGLKAADKIIGGTQSIVNGLDAYYNARDGEFQKAWENARDGVVNAGKTFGKYGEQFEAGGQAVDDLIRYGKATDTRQRVTSLMEFVGHGTKVGTIPGASNAGEAVLKAKDIVEQGYNFKDAYDLGRQDLYKPNLDRLSEEITGDYGLYIRLEEFRPLFNLPANPQAGGVLPVAPR